MFVYYTRIVFLFCFSSSCVPYFGSFPGKALIYVICGLTGDIIYANNLESGLVEHLADPEI